MIRAVPLAFLLLLCRLAFGQSTLPSPPGTPCVDQPCQLSVSNAASGDYKIAPGSLALLTPYLISPQSGGVAITSDSALLLSEGSIASIPLTLTAAPCPGYPVGNVNCVTQSLLAYIPRETPIRSATITVDYGNGLLAAAKVEIVETAFGLYTNFPQGQARAQNLTVNGVETNNLTHPAHPGDFLTLWGTGLGDARLNQITVMLPGLSLRPSYAGPSGGSPGLEQINVQMPSDASMPEGCYVPVLINTGETYSNVGTLSLSRARTPCAHPFSLSSDLLAQLDNDGSIYLGIIDLDSAIGPPPAGFAVGFVRTESASADFERLNASSIAALATDLYDLSLMNLVSFGGFRALPSSLQDFSFLAWRFLNGCQALPFNPSISHGGIVYGGGTIASPFENSLNVGPQVIITGGDNKSVGLLSFTFNFLGNGRFAGYQTSTSQTFTADAPEHLPPPFFSGGDWVASAPGSGEVQPFSVIQRVPRPIQLSNLDQLKFFDHNKSLLVSWDGTAYTADDFLTLRWEGSVTDSQGNPGSGGVLCRVPATDGKLNVPAELVAPFSTPLSGTFQVGLDRRDGSFKTFTIRLRNGTSVPGIFRSHSSELFYFTNF